MSRVSVVGGITDVRNSVRRSVELLGGLKLGSSDNVVIKPNICNSKNPNGAVITDFRVIKATVDLVREKTDNITLVESDNISGTAERRAERSGFLALCDELDAEFLNLSHDDYREYNVAGEKIRLPTTVLDSDFFINLPKIKTCAHTLVTLGIKNLYGVFQRRRKGRLHKHLDEVLPFLAGTIRNDLVIVDGINCMEGNGPVVGSHLCLDLIVAGDNVASVDSVCSSIMGFDPQAITHLANSAKRGVGEIDPSRIEVLGDDWRQFVNQFEPPYSLRASLKTVRSIRDFLTG